MMQAHGGMMGGARGYGRMMRGGGPGASDEPPRKTDARTVRRVIQAFAPYKGQVGVVLLAIILVGAMGVVNPYMLKYSISIGFAQQNFKLLSVFVGVMIITPIISGLIGVGQAYLNALVGQQVMRDLRNRLYSHLEWMPLKFFTDTRTGEIQSRLQNDVGGVQSVLSSTATSVVSNITTAVSTIVGMLFLSWQLTLLSLGLLPVFLYLTYRVGNVRREVSKETQESLAELSATMEETLSVSGVLLTKVFGRQRQEIAHFEQESDKLAGLQLRQQMVGRWFMMFISTFFSITPALVYLFYGYLAFGSGQHLNAQQLADIVGTLVAFTTLQSRLFFPIGSLLSVQVDLQGALALFDRIFEYLDLPHTISDKPDAQSLEPTHLRGEVAFDNVTFSYRPDQERPTLDQVSFDVRPGQLAALVGPSGAGKTTMTYLIPRLYDVGSGAVRIDGHDVRDVTLESLGQSIGVV
ncbi:MAG TPA: ABC transporter ATP-binding protein, partial [Ktedonobacterales bacterium]|nr:ABC transporter ATP-binding protein [Ktedonobacterales bacterium]